MQRAAIIGSCLSNLTVAAGLERNFGRERGYFVGHNRSDNLLRYYDDKNRIHVQRIGHLAELVGGETVEISRDQGSGAVFVRLCASR